MLTGPTQLRTTAACLAILARDAGSLTSHRIILTSDFSSAFPEIGKKNVTMNTGDDIIISVQSTPFFLIILTDN